MENKDRLSINRFKDRDLASLDDNEKQDYVFAVLLKDSINVLEGLNLIDRTFKRARFSMMTTIWDAYFRIKGEKELKDTKNELA